MKLFKGNRTRIFGALIGILGVIQIWGPEVLPDEYVGPAMMAVGIAIVILRQMTSTPAGQGATNDHTDIDTFQGGL